MSNEIDKLFRDRLGGHDSGGFEAGHWEGMESMLDSAMPVVPAESAGAGASSAGSSGAAGGASAGAALTPLVKGVIVGVAALVTATAVYVGVEMSSDEPEATKTVAIRKVKADQAVPRIEPEEAPIETAAASAEQSKENAVASLAQDQDQEDVAGNAAETALQDEAAVASANESVAARTPQTAASGTGDTDFSESKIQDVAQEERVLASAEDDGLLAEEEAAIPTPIIDEGLVGASMAGVADEATDATTSDVATLDNPTEADGTDAAGTEPVADLASNESEASATIDDAQNTDLPPADPNEAVTEAPMSLEALPPATTPEPAAELTFRETVARMPLAASTPSSELQTYAQPPVLPEAPGSVPVLKKFRPYVYLGYNVGWSMPNGVNSQSLRDLTPGLGLSFYLSNRVTFSLQAQYLNRSGHSLTHSSSRVNLFLWEEVKIEHITITRTEYLHLPFTTTFRFLNKHRIGGGAYASILLNTTGERYDEYVSPYNTIVHHLGERKGYIGGLHAAEFGLIGSYDFEFRPNFHLGMMMNYGVTNALDPKFYNSESGAGKSRTLEGQLYFRYDF